MPTSVEEIRLSGPSDLPDPAFNAYRRDVADLALAGRIIASHFVDPVEHRLRVPAGLKAGADEVSETLAELRADDSFLLIESRSGWAWGYGGAERRVGYVPVEALG